MGSKKAFSLLEMLVVAAIFTMVMTITYGMLMTGTNVQSTVMAQADLEEHARRVVKTISDEMQMALRSSLDPIPLPMDQPGEEKISFTVSEGFDQSGGVVLESNTITIQFVAPDRIERTVNDPGNPRTTILTHWVSYDPVAVESGLSFHLEGEDMMIILDLTREDNKGRRLEAFAFARVRLRNSAN